MDKELVRQREAFKKRALAQPTVEKRKQKSSDDGDRSAKKQKPASKNREPKPSSAAANFDYKTAQGSSQYKFSILARIVKYMKTKHQDNDLYPLSIEELLDETNQLDIGNKNRHWLVTEALSSNPKIQTVQEDGETKYKFKPKYEIKDRRALLNMLKKFDLHGEGGILMDDIEESLPHSQQAFKRLGDNITYITRPNDKKKILFYNDKYCQFNMDEEYTKLWRGVSVEGLDERKIEEYLEKQGITSMQDIGSKKVNHSKTKKKGGKRSFKRLNDHMEGVFKDYGELKASKTG